ncbi:MAG: 30S ribosomal protein S20 [Nitrospirae bacterium]|nr:30S ribosomal protein S20 [Nitrospirota bacterium]
MAAKSAPKKNLSAIKKVRQDEKRKLRGQSIRTSIKTDAKRLETVLSSGSKEEMHSILKGTISSISKAASKGIIHKNTASRKISRLTKKVNASQSKGAQG